MVTTRTSANHEHLDHAPFARILRLYLPQYHAKMGLAFENDRSYTRRPDFWLVVEYQE